MSNADTIKAIITNIETVLAASPHLLRKIDIPLGIPEFVPNFTDPPVFYILYNGETPEYVYGQKAGYIEADLTIALLWQASDISTVRGKAIDWFHALRGALTINALNVGSLATSKLVSLVTVDKPGLDVTPAETNIFFKITVRYREA